MKRTTLGGTAVLALVMAMLLTGCPSPTGGGGDGDNNNNTDTWTNVTSLSQINGTWKRTDTETITEDPDTGSPIPSDLTITVTTEQTSTVNASAGTGAYTVKITVKFTQSPGGTTDLNSAWNGFKTYFESEYPTATFVDATYTATVTENYGPSSITLADIGSVQINQTKTKIKIAGEEWTKQ